MIKRLLLSALLFLLLMPGANAQDETFTITDESGTLLTYYVGLPEKGDEYISRQNKHYVVQSVDENALTAVAQLQGDYPMPSVEWLRDSNLTQPVSGSEQAVAIYCTHSDESYEPTDGVYSDEQRGTIYEVADALAEAFEERGVSAEVSDALHHPHDAGAYRRSRQTAVQLLKAMPDAIFDIHRDGIPDPDEYAATIGGTEMSKVRILVGRGNQNMEVNKKLAARIKAIADKVYPGLIKDIYMGKGTYNQDLSPQSLLFECGTYTLEREAVEKSMPLLAHVTSRALYGGMVGSAGASDAGSGAKAQSGGVTQGATDAPTAVEDASGAGTGAIWVAGVFVVGVIVFAVVSTGSARGAAKKVGRNISEMTGGLIGKKPGDDEKPPEA